MRKFTIFTIILSALIVIMASEVFISDYLPNLVRTKTDDMPVTDELPLPNTLSTNILGADIDYTNLEDLEYEEVDLSNPDALIPIPETLDELTANTTTLPTQPIERAPSSDFEDENFYSFTQNVLLREDQVQSAGFNNAYIENEAHNGFLYKTIYIDDLYDVKASKYVIRNESSLLAKVYVFEMGPMSGIAEVYEVLKMRGSEGLDIDINATNDFGDASFYMNDARRTSVVFLTVRIGSYIYGFSYPKDYHAQIKNLITLLDLEF